MGSFLIYPKGITSACTIAAATLKQSGFTLTDHPCPEITHLLLDVPSFTADGKLRGGENFQRILEMLPPSVTIIGGNLSHPCLQEHRVIDLLRNPAYLAENAAITAECALRIAGSMLPVTLPDCPTLIIGWGRIGKCLAMQLRALRCPVIIAARDPAHRAIASALGIHAVDLPEIPTILVGIRLLFNTVPAQVIDSAILATHKNCLKIDLASIPGLSCEDTVYARGLPGQYAPESSGKLIARSVLRCLKEEEV